MDDLVHPVLERLHDALGDVAHVLLLDPAEYTVVTADQAPADVLAGSGALVTALAAVVDPDGGSTAIVETAAATLYAWHRSGGLAAVLVGPPSWNVALARRTADPLLRELLTDDLARGVRAAASAADTAPAVTPPSTVPSAATSPGGTPLAGTRAQASRADAVRHVPRAD